MPPNSQPLPLEPAVLAAFRQQGAVVLARERGLSPVCRIRLTEIARGLGIADDQIEEAIRSLAAAEPIAPPNEKVERFRRRLRKDLAGKSRTIIGPTIESRILAAAKRKYGLDAAHAGQLLCEVAAELGLTCITATSAIQSLAAQIDQAAGDSTWLAREAWDRLRSAGCQWGLELEVIDQMIDERLAANRADYVRRSTTARTTLYVAVGAVVAACIILAGMTLARKTRSERELQIASGASADLLRPRPSVPTWWDADLAVEMAHAKSGLGGLAGACDLMASSTPAKRAAGYERLFEQVRAAPQWRELLAAASRIFAGCHALEADEEAATRLRSALLSLLPTSETPLPASAASWSLSFWAADVAAAGLDRRGASRERIAALAQVIEATIGRTIDLATPRVQRQQTIRERTVLAAYRQLAAAAGKEPGQVAVLYPALAQRAALVLTEDEALRTETTFLVAALPAAGSDWKPYERPLVRCISSPDPLPALRLLDALRRASDPKLIAHLTELLVVRAGARPKSTDKKDVISAVRQSLGGETASITAADRWQSLREEATAALAASETISSEPELLSHVVGLAHLTTLAIALAQGESGFATFDAGLANPPQLAPAASSESKLAPASSVSANADRRLSKSQQRELGQILDVLDNPGPGMQPQREAALRSLASLADETSDIPPHQGAPLAQYLFTEKTAAEQAKALATIAEARHWNHLRLAVADQLLTTKVPLPQQRAIAASLLGRELEPGALAPQLRRLLLASVADSLINGASSSAGELLDKAAELLAQSYRQRAALLNAATASIAGARLPGPSLELSLAAVNAALPGKREEADRLAQELKALQYLAGDDLHYTVAVQRLLVDRSAHRIAAQAPQHAGAARKIAAESIAASSAAPTVLAQLRDQEAALLKLWMLYGPDV